MVCAALVHDLSVACFDTELAVGKVINKERKSIRDIVNAMKNHPDDLQVKLAELHVTVITHFYHTHLFILQIQEHCAHILSTAVRVTERPGASVLSWSG